MSEKEKNTGQENETADAIDQHKKSIGKSVAGSTDEKHTSEKKTEKTGVESADRNDPTGNSHLSSKK